MSSDGDAARPFSLPTRGQEKELQAQHLSSLAASRELPTSPITKQPAVPTTKPPSKRGRPSKNSVEVWMKLSTETLFTVRYVTAKDEFSRARNHVEVSAAWVLVATLLNKAEEATYTVSQCKDKIKWLKKTWSLYREDRHTTGNIPKAAAPPCLELMLEHWAPNPGMQNTSLCDGTVDHDDAESDNHSTHDEKEESNRAKRKKSNGECVEEGLRALAGGVMAVGDAMKSNASAVHSPGILRPRSIARKKH